jgi:seryl-tRNA synthetase
MNDLDFIINNPQEFEKSMYKRGLEVSSNSIIDLYNKKKSKTSEMQSLQNEKNEINKEFINQISDKEILIQKSREIENKIVSLKSELEEITNELNQILLNLPNIPDSSVPIGKDENSNKEISRHGTIRKFSFEPRPHDEIGEKLGLLDFKQTSKISGARFCTLKGDLAKLSRMLMNFMIEHNKSYGYVEHFTPFLVKESAMYGAGQLPKFSDESFVVDGNFRLIPTSEVTLTNLAADRIFSPDELPLRMTAYSECFRSEAGSAGKDTKGMIRQHQFGKVELVSITKPEDSDTELERMVSIVEDLLSKLELPYRKVILCTGDLGFCAKKTYDIEVWIPSQNCYREISSCSNCGDFQSRRMNAKYKDNKKNKFLHTLNGSSLAIGRTIVAIIENYQNVDGSFTLPNKLINYY